MSAVKPIYARAFDWRNIEFYTKKPFAFSNDEAGFDVQGMGGRHQGKFGKTIVIPGMEPTGHYWFQWGKFLQDNGMKPVHVNPHHVKKSKELDDNNPNKNERIQRRLRHWSMKEDSLYPIYTNRYLCGDQKFIFVSRRQEDLHESKTESHDGLPFIFLNTKTFTGFNGN